MTTTMAEFVSQRLRRARIARMMTGRALAEAVGVTPAAITQFEKGDASPRDEVVRRLAEALRVPPTHFFNPPLPDRQSPVRMRSLSAATKRARESADVRIDWLREVVVYVAQVMPLSLLDLPDLCQTTDPAAISDDEIEDFAVDARRMWGMKDGPIVNLTELLESKGLVVSAFSLGADTLDAFGTLAPELPIIVENTDRTSAVRMRFDRAHEVAHMVLHRHTPDALAARPEIHKLMEHQAHRFAGAFLFPAAAFVNEIYSVTVAGLLDAKRRWKLSVQTMIRRAFDLGLISEYQYGRAFRTLSAKGFRKREPLDDEMAPEEPTAIPQRLRHLVEEQGFTAEDIEAHTHQHRREIEALASLPPGYFDRPRGPQVGGRILRLRPRSTG